MYLKKLIKALVVFALAGFIGNSAIGQDRTKPNIVLILADDLGYADLSCYGSPLCRTPNIDHLAAQGMRFTEAYAACPVCSPSRAAIMTGKYPARLHITDWIPGENRMWEKLALPHWLKSGLPASETTVAELLKQQGYACGTAGKWHLGKIPPTEQGFEVGGEDWDLNKKQDERDPKGVFTLARQALDFIEKNRDKPFFFYLSYYAVHLPLRYDSTVKAKYEKLAGSNNPIDPGYAAMVEAMDDSVGIFLKGLADLGVADNTLIIFTSDNGGLQGPTQNAPLRAGKGTLYEGGIRVPMIVKWPGHVRTGTESSAVITGVDYLPTFCEIAGTTNLPDSIDGTSFLQAITKNSSLKRDAVYWHYPHYHKGGPGGVIRKGNYKLIEFLEDGHCELYDLGSDIGEKNDLAKKMPEKADELLGELRAWRTSVGAQMMEPNPDYDPKRVGKKPRKNKSESESE